MKLFGRCNAACLVYVATLTASSFLTTQAQEVTPRLAKTIDIHGIVEEFDGVRPTLVLTETHSVARLVQHVRTDQSPFRGRRSEFLHFWGKRGGERVLATHDIVPLSLISELKVACWVKGNLPNVQIMLRVRLPRTLDDDGTPLSLHLLGDRYESVGDWEQLRVADFDKQFAERVRAMRAAYQQPVDTSEAYVDQVLFNLFGGPEENVIWLDDLSIQSGIPARTPSQDSTIPKDAGSPKQLADDQVPLVALCRGQALSDLARLGFNGVVFPKKPSISELRAASKLQLAVIGLPGEAVDQPRPDLGSLVNQQYGWKQLHAKRWLPLRRQLRTAIFSGSDGFVFDPAEFSSSSEYAAAASKLLTLEVSLFRPWILRRQFVQRMHTMTPHDEPSSLWAAMFDRHAAIISLDRPFVSTNRQQVSVDVPDSLNRQAYAIAPGRVSPLETQRIPGGVRIRCSRNASSDLILLTNQPNVLRSYADHLTSLRKRYHEALIRIIQIELLDVDKRLTTSRDRQLAIHLRKQIHDLHSQLAAVLSLPTSTVGYQQLDHFLHQLEKVQQVLHQSSAESVDRLAAASSPVVTNSE